MKRIPILDNMQGLAMLLVVTGHLAVGSFQPDWYNPGLRSYIYSFHMALFIFISGFLIRYSYKPVLSIGQYRQYVGKRFNKFFIPFLVVGFICLGLTAFARSFTWPQIWDGVLALLLAHRKSYSGFLWYIYLLFILYCFSPLIFSLPQKMNLGIGIAALIPALWPVPTQWFGLEPLPVLFLLYGQSALRRTPAIVETSSRISADCRVGRVCRLEWLVLALW